MPRVEMPDPDVEQREQLERYGLDQVELMFAHGFIGGNNWVTIEFIQKKRAERAAVDTKRLAEQERIAASANRAAWIAAWASIIGLLIGVVGVAVTILF